LVPLLGIQAGFPLPGLVVLGMRYVLPGIGGGEGG
jgi:hypothetical protein